MGLMGFSEKESYEYAFKKYKTLNNTYKMFPLKTKVKIISPPLVINVVRESYFFCSGQTGVVVKNKLDIKELIVKLDTPLITVYSHFNFDPRCLIKIKQDVNKLDEKIPTLRDQKFNSCFWCKHGENQIISGLICNKHGEHISDKLKFPVCDDFEEMEDK